MIARKSLVLASTLLALAGPLGARESDPEWKTHRAEFERAMGGNATPAAREQAVRGLGRADRPEAVDVLLNVLEWKNQDMSQLLASRAKIQKQIDQLIELANNQRNAQGQPSLSQGDLDRFNQLNDVDLKNLNEQIIQENVLRNAAVEALSSMREDDSVDRIIEKGLKDSSWRVRSGVAEAFAEIKPDRATQPLIGLVADKDPKVQLAAMETLAAMGKKEAVDAILGQIANKNWQVRAAAAHALGALGDPKAIKPLIDQLQEEEGRLLEDFDAALQALTGHTTHANPPAWISWWNANKDKLDEIVSKRDQTAEGDENVGKTVTFYGITTRSKRIMFIIDISGSMQGPANAMPQPANTGENGGASPFGKLPAQPTKFDVARHELKNAIHSLPDDGKFNIIHFSTAVKILSETSMIDAKKKVKEQAYDWVDKLVADGATNIYDAIARAFELAGEGNVEANFKVGVDTIFFLTDGAPTHGAIQEPGKILEDVKQRNGLRRIKIHVVGVGLETVPPEMEEFLKKLAADNDGQFVRR